MKAFSFFFLNEFYLLGWCKNHIFVEDVFIESYVSTDDDFLRFREKDSVGLLCFANTDEHALLALRIQLASHGIEGKCFHTKNSNARHIRFALKPAFISCYGIGFGQASVADEDGVGYCFSPEFVRKAT